MWTGNVIIKQIQEKISGANPVRISVRNADPQLDIPFLTTCKGRLKDKKKL